MTELQEITLNGRRIRFAKYMNPGTPQHLQSIAENYLKTKLNEPMEIII
jgi:hypothetical protein